jgi:hypothetical protein
VRALVQILESDLRRWKIRNSDQSKTKGNA